MFNLTSAINILPSNKKEVPEFDDETLRKNYEKILPAEEFLRIFGNGDSPEKKAYKSVEYITFYICKGSNPNDPIKECSQDDITKRLCCLSSPEPGGIYSCWKKFKTF